MILIKKILTIDIGYESLVKIFFISIIYFANTVYFRPGPCVCPSWIVSPWLEVNPLIRLSDEFDEEPDELEFDVVGAV